MPDLARLDRSCEPAVRHRRRRSLAAAAVAGAGLLDLSSVLRPSLHQRLHLLALVVPLVVSQTAAAFVGLAGLALVALSRGIQRGQRHAQAVAGALLGTIAVLALLQGVDAVGALVSLGVVYLLAAFRSSFRAAADGPSGRAGLLALVVGGLTATVAVTLAIELATRVDRDGPVPPVARTATAIAERLVGIHSIALPGAVPPVVTPGLLLTGTVLLLVASSLCTRPVVDRRRGAGEPSHRRARTVVDRYGSGTLDYFALRHDKQHFFFGDTLVTYAVRGGVCLVSPDPIGPEHERLAAWAAFRAFADANGWTVAALGTGEAWLASYRAAGMRHCYVGDEAVVDLTRFSLDGGRHKSLRQAVNRIARHGYTVSFHDPASLDGGLAAALRGVSANGRRGGAERGFSMTLGRLFDPADLGLLLAVARDRQGEPVAFCQFVPAPGIDGYSLDLMRRDGADHPNGLVDFLLVATIEHLRQRSMSGLALNFAALRSIVAGQGGSIATRAVRLGLRRLSRSMQIESLWRYSAKFDPTWVARHVVFDRRRDLPAIALAIARVESFVELPVLGRLLAKRRSPLAGLASALRRLAGAT